MHLCITLHAAVYLNMVILNYYVSYGLHIYGTILFKDFLHNFAYLLPIHHVTCTLAGVCVCAYVCVCMRACVRVCGLLIIAILNFLL